MPLQDSSGRLAADACSVEQRNRANDAAAGYVLAAWCPAGGPADVSSRGGRRGHGVDACAVEADTALRARLQTRGAAGCRAQLQTRVFQAVPDLSHGGGPWTLCADAAGADTKAASACARLTERDFARFDPGVCAVPVQNVVPPWVRGGVPSRLLSSSASGPAPTPR